MSLTLLLICFALFAVTYCESQYIVQYAKLPPSGYQPWAHRHWVSATYNFDLNFSLISEAQVWLHNGESTQQNVLSLVEGYKNNSIPIGAVNIDSMWATEFNNFIVDTKKFPDLQGLIKELHDQNIKVILWATSMVNVENPDYEMCVEKNYLIRTSKGNVLPIKWWHGSGGLLDYSNPEAVAWWHKQMDKVLDLGIDGFKCDGTDPYILEYEVLGGAFNYQGQRISYQDYANMYYRDFLHYTRERRGGGDAGLIMSRPVDCMLDGVTKVCWGYSPKDVMFSGWVGDDDATFNGLRGCMRKIIYSAWDGYANFGCDIGGYRGQSVSSKVTFLRWAQAMAFLPLMENGGGGEHRPWGFDTETVAIYRKYAKEHHRLVPYLLTMGAVAMEKGGSAVTPVAVRPPSVSFERPAAKSTPWYPQPSTFSYMLGTDILVHPVLSEGVNVTHVSMVDMIFPDVGGVPTEWMDWWQPYDAKRIHKGGMSEQRTVVPLEGFPVYVRRGALLPLALLDQEDAVVFHWFGPQASPEGVSPVPVVTFGARQSEVDGTGVEATASFTAEGSGVVQASVTAHRGKGGFVLVGISEPADVAVQSVAGAGCQHAYNKITSTLSVLCASVVGGLKITVTGVSSNL